MKILIMGLAGSGKTTLAKVLAHNLNAVHFNADDVRQNINKDLGFSVEDRLEQAKRMGHLCDIVVSSGHNVVADFICPTKETRRAFGSAFIICVDRIKESIYIYTNAIFEAPDNADIRIPSGLTLQEELEMIMKIL